jgi:hypothetical protein
VQTVLVWRRDDPSPVVKNFLECFAANTKAGKG